MATVVATVVAALWYRVDSDAAVVAAVWDRVDSNLEDILKVRRQITCVAGSGVWCFRSGGRSVSVGFVGFVPGRLAGGRGGEWRTCLRFTTVSGTLFGVIWRV